MTAKVNATFYAQFKADRRYWGDKVVFGMHAVKLTQNKPSKVEADCIVVKFKTMVDVDAFEHLPVVTVDIPLGSVQQVAAEAVTA